MSRMHAMAASLVVASALLFAGNVASADAPVAQRSSGFNAVLTPVEIELAGVVESVVVEGGTREGVRLASGTTVLFADTGSRAFRALRPGARVAVRGVAKPNGDPTVLRDATLITSR